MGCNLFWGPSHKAHTRTGLTLAIFSSVCNHHHHHHHQAASLVSPKPLPKRVLQTVRSFNCQYLLFSLRSSSSCFRLLSLYPSHLSFQLSFSSVFQQAVPSQDLTNPVSRPRYLLYVGCFFLSCLVTCNTSSFFTGSVQLISNILQHHISKLLIYFPQYSTGAYLGLGRLGSCLGRQI